MTAEQAMELDRQQHDHANASAHAASAHAASAHAASAHAASAHAASANTGDAHYDAAYGFYLDHGFWPVGDEELAGY